MKENKQIIVSKKNHIGKITFNRPESLNALNDEISDALIMSLRELDADPEIRAILLTGAGRAFCAGADLKGGAAGTRLNAGGSGEEVRQTITKAQKAPYMLHNMEKPTIALVNGAAVGGGMDLALACDIRIGCEHARFSSAFVRIGAIPGTGGAWLLPRIVGVNKAAELLFTGDLIEAEEAYRIGILNKIVPLEKLDEEGMVFADRLAAGAPVAMKLIKMLLYEGLQMDFKTALKMTAACESIALTSSDRVEGVQAFLEKRPAKFKGL